MLNFRYRGPLLMALYMNINGRGVYKVITLSCPSLSFQFSLRASFAVDKSLKNKHFGPWYLHEMVTQK